MVIVADERMNAILVQASRADRDHDRKLPESHRLRRDFRRLDGLETAHGAAAQRQGHADRGDAADDFQAQLGTKIAVAGGGSTGLFATELAVDEVTNSLIIVAPPPLAERLADFARSLDAAAMENASREVSIISLKKSRRGPGAKNPGFADGRHHGLSGPRGASPVSRPHCLRGSGARRYGEEELPGSRAEEDGGFFSVEDFASVEGFAFSDDFLR